jgi:DNA mismatch endonuclease, patch repair protein
MARITSKDTQPELRVRSFLHSHGLRYRLHTPDLPGKPDLVFRSYRACLFVHGCFWHGCRRCADGKHTIKSNTEYWKRKIASNRARDKRNRCALKALGWKVHVVWACEAESGSKLISLLQAIRASGHMAD